MQIVPPRFCHYTTQNTPKHVISSEKNFFLERGLSLSYNLPLLPTNPLESAPSSPRISKQVYANDPKHKIETEKTAVADRTIYTLIWYTFYNLQP